MALGERIRECRQRARLSQEKVAELVGVSRQAVTKWEMNQSAPNTENLFRLAEVFGTTVDFLAEPDNKEEPLTLAEQIHALYKAEEERKEAQKRLQKRYNIFTALAVAGGYLAIFLAGKLLGSEFRSDMLLWYWLTNTEPTLHSYLFGWLLARNLYLAASLISILPALWGKRRFSLVTLGGFALALPLGEFLGRNPAGAAYGFWHYGWAIWCMEFLLSIIMGAWLQRFKKEDISFHNKIFLLWVAVAIVGTVAIVILVRSQMPSYT